MRPDTVGAAVGAARHRSTDSSSSMSRALDWPGARGAPYRVDDVRSGLPHPSEEASAAACAVMVVLVLVPFALDLLP